MDWSAARHHSTTEHWRYVDLQLVEQTVLEEAISMVLHAIRSAFRRFDGRVVFVPAFFAALSLVTGAASAQCTPGWQPGDAITGVSGDVSAVATLPGGDIVVAGQFGTAGNAMVRTVAHWSSETRTW